MFSKAEISADASKKGRQAGGANKRDPPIGVELFALDAAFLDRLAFQQVQRQFARRRQILGVVTRDAVLQGQKGSEPLLLGLTEILHVVEGLARAEQCAEGDGQHVHQLAISGDIHSHIRQVFDVFDQTKFGMFCIPGLNQKISTQKSPTDSEPARLMAAAFLRCTHARRIT